MSAKAEKQTDDQSGVEMVTIKDSLYPEDRVEIPKVLHDKMLNRYADVNDFTALKSKIIEADKDIKATLHQYEDSLPKNESGEVCFVFSGIEHKLSTDKKEKFKQRKADQDEIEDNG